MYRVGERGDDSCGFVSHCARSATGVKNWCIIPSTIFSFRRRRKHGRSARRSHRRRLALHGRYLPEIHIASVSIIGRSSGCKGIRRRAEIVSSRSESVVSGRSESVISSWSERICSWCGTIGLSSHRSILRIMILRCNLVVRRGLIPATIWARTSRSRCWRHGSTGRGSWLTVSTTVRRARSRSSSALINNRSRRSTSSTCSNHKPFPLCEQVGTS